MSITSALATHEIKQCLCEGRLVPATRAACSESRRLFARDVTCPQDQFGVES